MSDLIKSNFRNSIRNSVLKWTFLYTIGMLLYIFLGLYLISLIHNEWVKIFLLIIFFISCFVIIILLNKNIIKSDFIKYLPCPHCDKSVLVYDKWQCPYCENFQKKEKYITTYCDHCEREHSNETCEHCKNEFQL